LRTALPGFRARQSSATRCTARARGEQAPDALFARRCGAQALAQEVACFLGLNLSNIKIKRFADGEIYVQVQARARDAPRHPARQCCQWTSAWPRHMLMAVLPRSPRTDRAAMV